MIGETLIGTPYLPGGRNPEEGLDCYGLVVTIYAMRGYHVPDILEELVEGVWTAVAVPETYDLIQVGTAHCGLYIYPGKLLHTTVHTGAVLSPFTPYAPMITGYYHYTGRNT